MRVGVLGQGQVRCTCTVGSGCEYCGVRVGVLCGLGQDVLHYYHFY